MAFLHASASRQKQRRRPSQDNNNPTIVLVHDCDRPAYHLADTLLYKQESGGILCQYTRRPETTDAQLLDLWMQQFVNVA